MLVKNPKPQVRKWIKKIAAVAFVVEAVSFAFTYYGWTQVNTNRETRKYLNDNYPAILEAYYKTGEIIDSTNKIREIDHAYWNAQKVTSLLLGAISYFYARYRLCLERVIGKKSQFKFITLMEPNKIVKSIFWLTSLSGLGYLLLLIASKSQDSSQLKKNPAEYPNNKSTLSKNEQFMNVLQSATASNKPLYRLSKEELDKVIKRQ